MNKISAGTLILDGTNTYLGDTKVTAGTLKFAATVSIASSTIDVFGGILDVTAFGGPGYTLAGGKTLKGNGTVNGFVNVLGGTVSPGESPGTLTVGDMTFGSGSTLNIELNGTAAGLFDVLNSTGALIVQPGSTLAVSLGYTPLPGDSFDIMNWGSESGTFDTLSLPTLPDGFTWDSSNLYTNGSIAVVPEPATMLMLIIAAGLCLMFKRARNK
jgi:autotransporter-associated beta strand protein